MLSLFAKSQKIQTGTTINKSDMKNGIVLFAGAGCSMAPPSSLPGWVDLNDAIIETLWDRLEPYGLRNAFREKIIPAIKERRRESKFPPDYQAQRMVERVGMKYFELLSAVDSDVFNPVQYYSSKLAEAGFLKAVVTTNFDKNFERAFEQANVPFLSCFDEDGFDRLFLNPEGGPTPIIKIHGCCSLPRSMVDTKKQRLKGRAKALESVLSMLLRNYHFVFAGFSGQDFDDNENYLGIRDAAPSAKGFAFLNRPGTEVRESIVNLISFYGENKAELLICDAADYLQNLLKELQIPVEPFLASELENRSIKERLKEKIASVAPMDAINMLTALAESCGDEISARHFYDTVWNERSRPDYNEAAFSRFLLNHGRSYVFNFQDKKQRAENAGVFISQIGLLPEGLDETRSSPAKMNLRHAENTLPENFALIGLVQSYLGNPVLFREFPSRLLGYFRSKPTPTELADIVFYYSFHALIYGDIEGLAHLNMAIKDMEEDFDEPRLSQLLSRRAMLLLRVELPDAVTLAAEDVRRARELAEKYHEPHLLALSALASAVLARNNRDFTSALSYVTESEKNYFELKRIPQYVETMMECLKIVKLGFEMKALDTVSLANLVSDIQNKVEKHIIDEIPVFEPEYCYLMGIIHEFDLSRHDMALSFFADAINLADFQGQDTSAAYFRETCRQLGYLNEVETLIAAEKEKNVGR